MSCRDCGAKSKFEKQVIKALNKLNAVDQDGVASIGSAMRAIVNQLADINHTLVAIDKRLSIETGFRPVKYVPRGSVPPSTRL